MSNKEPKRKCPECDSTDLGVYLYADYNSTIDNINCEGHVVYNYSDALTDIYCMTCNAEFEDVEKLPIIKDT